jgi:hypothetical protein
MARRALQMPPMALRRAAHTLALGKALNPSLKIGKKFPQTLFCSVARCYASCGAKRLNRSSSKANEKEVSMGLFGTILEKLGFGGASTSAAQSSATTSGTPASPGAPAAAPKPVAVVDVVAQLEKRAAANPQKLNWRTSIVDLLKLLDIDSSFNARKELATELGCPADLMGDSAKMNMWLHKTVLQRIADNGGNVPKELLN